MEAQCVALSETCCAYIIFGGVDKKDRREESQEKR